MACKTSYQHAHMNVSPHSMDRTFVGSGSSPPDQRYRRTEDLILLCLVSQGLVSEPYRITQGVWKSGPSTPGLNYWLATHIHNIKDKNFNSTLYIHLNRLGRIPNKLAAVYINVCWNSYKIVKCIYMKM